MNILPNREDKLLQSYIDAYLKKSAVNARAISRNYEMLWREIGRVINSGGKRIRPKLVFLSYHSLGGDDLDLVSPIAASQELMHVSLLIHDDIIDRDFSRHGVDNIAGAYKKRYAKYKDNKLADHYALSAALLAGDLLLAGAHELIAESSASDELKRLCLGYLDRAIFEVGGGEFIETESAIGAGQEETALIVARYKTAGYSFSIPLCMGAILAGANSDQIEAFNDFGNELGVAFQLQDDLLGVFGDESRTGKSNSSDLEEAKKTFLVECFFKTANKIQADEFKELFGRSGLTTTQTNKLRDLLLISGAKKQVQDKILLLEKRARKQLQRINLDERYNSEFDRLIDSCLRRDK